MDDSPFGLSSRPNPGNNGRKNKFRSDNTPHTGLSRNIINNRNNMSNNMSNNRAGAYNPFGIGGNTDNNDNPTNVRNNNNNNNTNSRASTKKGQKKSSMKSSGNQVNTSNNPFKTSNNNNINNNMRTVDAFNRMNTQITNSGFTLGLNNNSNNFSHAGMFSNNDSSSKNTPKMAKNVKFQKISKNSIIPILNSSNEKQLPQKKQRVSFGIIGNNNKNFGNSINTNQNMAFDGQNTHHNPFSNSFAGNNNNNMANNISNSTQFGSFLQNHSKKSQSSAFGATQTNNGTAAVTTKGVKPVKAPTKNKKGAKSTDAATSNTPQFNTNNTFKNNNDNNNNNNSFSSTTFSNTSFGSPSSMPFGTSNTNVNTPFGSNLTSPFHTQQSNTSFGISQTYTPFGTKPTSFGSSTPSPFGSKFGNNNNTNNNNNNHKNNNNHNNNNHNNNNTKSALGALSTPFGQRPPSSSNPFLNNTSFGHATLSPPKFPISGSPSETTNSYPFGKKGNSHNINTKKDSTLKKDTSVSQFTKKPFGSSDQTNTMTDHDFFRDDGRKQQFNKSHTTRSLSPQFGPKSRPKNTFTQYTDDIGTTDITNGVTPIGMAIKSLDEPVASTTTKITTYIEDDNQILPPASLEAPVIPPPSPPPQEPLYSLLPGPPLHIIYSLLPREAILEYFATAEEFRKLISLQDSPINCLGTSFNPATSANDKELAEAIIPLFERGLYHARSVDQMVATFCKLIVPQPGAPSHHDASSAILTPFQSVSPDTTSQQVAIITTLVQTLLSFLTRVLQHTIESAAQYAHLHTFEFPFRHINRPLQIVIVPIQKLRDLIQQYADLRNPKSFVLSQALSYDRTPSYESTANMLSSFKTAPQNIIASNTTSTAPLQLSLKRALPPLLESSTTQQNSAAAMESSHVPKKQATALRNIITAQVAFNNASPNSLKPVQLTSQQPKVISLPKPSIFVSKPQIADIGVADDLDTYEGDYEDDYEGEMGYYGEGEFDYYPEGEQYGELDNIPYEGEEIFEGDFFDGEGELCFDEELPSDYDDHKQSLAPAPVTIYTKKSINIQKPRDDAGAKAGEGLVWNLHKQNRDFDDRKSHKLQQPGYKPREAIDRDEAPALNKSEQRSSKNNNKMDNQEKHDTKSKSMGKYDRNAKPTGSFDSKNNYDHKKNDKQGKKPPNINLVHDSRDTKHKLDNIKKKINNNSKYGENDKDNDRSNKNSLKVDKKVNKDNIVAQDIGKNQTKTGTNITAQKYLNKKDKIDKQYHMNTTPANYNQKGGKNNDKVTKSDKSAKNKTKSDKYDENNMTKDTVINKRVSWSGQQPVSTHKNPPNPKNALSRPPNQQLQLLGDETTSHSRAQKLPSQLLDKPFSHPSQTSSHQQQQSFAPSYNQSGAAPTSSYQGKNFDPHYLQAKKEAMAKEMCRFDTHCTREDCRYKHTHK